MKKNELSQVGVDPDGRRVMAGVFKEYETSGCPLDLILSILADNGILVCWISLYREARMAGMKHNRVLSMLDPAIVDSYGSNMRNTVLTRLNDYFGDSKKGN